MLHHILIHFLSIGVIKYRQLRFRTAFKVLDIESGVQEESVYLTKCYVRGALAIYNFPLSVPACVYKGGAANGECNPVLPGL